MFQLIADGYIVAAAIGLPLYLAGRWALAWRTRRRLEGTEAITIDRGVGIATDSRGVVTVIRTKGINQPQAAAAAWVAGHQLAQRVEMGLAEEAGLVAPTEPPIDLGAAAD